MNYSEIITDFNGKLNRHEAFFESPDLHAFALLLELSIMVVLRGTLMIVPNVFRSNWHCLSMFEK